MAVGLMRIRCLQFLRRSQRYSLKSLSLSLGTIPKTPESGKGILELKDSCISLPGVLFPAATSNELAAEAKISELGSEVQASRSALHLVALWTKARLGSEMPLPKMYKMRTSGLDEGMQRLAVVSELQSHRIEY